MPPLEPPPVASNKSDTWFATAKPGFRNPQKLWGDYWQRFNTITIPLLDEDAYFADALDAARRASDRDHLEELLAAKHDERRRSLEEVLRTAALDSLFSRGRFPSEAARCAVLKAGQTGSLDSFLQVVCGVLYGWEGGDDSERQLRDSTSATHAGNDHGSGGGCAYDGGYDEEDIESDPYEEENGQLRMPRPWEAWEEDEEEAFNARPRRAATDCGGADEITMGQELLSVEPSADEEEEEASNARPRRATDYSGADETTMGQEQLSVEPSADGRDAPFVTARGRDGMGNTPAGDQPLAAVPNTEDAPSARALSTVPPGATRALAHQSPLPPPQWLARDDSPGPEPSGPLPTPSPESSPPVHPESSNPVHSCQPRMPPEVDTSEVDGPASARCERNGELSVVLGSKRKRGLSCL